MKIGIIGSAGRMGAFLAALFKEQGWTVLESDVSTEGLNNQELAAQSDIVLVSVPMEATRGVIEEILEHLKPGSLLAEITSVKSVVAGVLEYAKEFPIEVLSLHPLFGPMQNVEGQNMIYIKVADGDKTKELLDFFQVLNLRLVETTLEEHDKKTAQSQALFHALLRLSNHVDPDFATTSFRKIQQLVDKMKRQQSMYDAIFELNPRAREALDAFVGELEEKKPTS